MANCSPSELIADAKCFASLAPSQKDAIIAILLCKILQARSPMATCDAESLLTDAKCFMSLQPQQLQAIIAQLLCEILHSGGTGETCIICLDGEESPVDPPACDCAIAYNMNGSFWFWNSVTTSWFAISI